MSDMGGQAHGDETARPRAGEPVPARRDGPARESAGKSAGAPGDGLATAREDGPASAGSQPGPLRNGEAVSRFIERFAAVLTEAGIPRMPARVFAALLATDSGRLTAAELAALLQASPAAVSGGVRYLIGVGMVRREGEPGSRRHHYRVPDNVWDEVIRIRDRLMTRWTTVLREGIGLLGADTPAGVRLTESVQYFEFVSAELPRVVARWQERKAALDGKAARER
jgi:predicted transcriptional regulator